MLSSVYSVCTRQLPWHPGVTSCQKVIKEMWWAPTELIRTALLLAGTGRVAVKRVSVRAGAKGESPGAPWTRGWYRLQHLVRLQISCWVRAAETFHIHQGREQEMLLIAVNNGLNLKHISSYRYKNGFFYLPAGRAPTNRGEASVNCWDLNCFKIRPLIFIKLLNDDDHGRYYRRDLLWHGSI